MSLLVLFGVRHQSAGPRRFSLLSGRDTSQKDNSSRRQGTSLSLFDNPRLLRHTNTSCMNPSTHRGRGQRISGTGPTSTRHLYIMKSRQAAGRQAKSTKAAGTVDGIICSVSPARAWQQLTRSLFSGTLFFQLFSFPPPPSLLSPHATPRHVTSRHDTSRHDRTRYDRSRLDSTRLDAWYSSFHSITRMVGHTIRHHSVEWAHVTPRHAASRQVRSGEEQDSFTRTEDSVTGPAVPSLSLCFCV